jgi:hypothetical protein
MIITAETSSYNSRRMGKPWIATVDFTTPKGEFSWGDWTGDHYNGGEGVLSIDAAPGSIIAIGQKDNRQPRNSAPVFYVATAAGDLDLLGDKGDAYKHYLAHRDSTPDHTALRAERDQLIARIAEIDIIINA